MVFELAGEEYQLRRSMRGKDLKVEAELKVNGLLVASSEKGVTSTIEERLGMDHKAFFISVFARQKDLNALSTLSAAERKKLVLRMLDVDVLDDVVKDIDKDALEVKKAVQFVNEQLLTSDRRSKREVLSEEINVLNKDMERSKKELDDLNLRAAKMEEELTRAKGQKEWSALKDEEHRGRKEQMVKKKAEVGSLGRSVSDLSMEARVLKERLTSMPELEKSSAEHEELLRKRDKMEEDLRTYERTKAVRADVQRMSKELDAISSDSISKNEQMSPLKRSADGLRTVLRSLEDVDGSMSTSRERSTFLVSEIKRTSKEDRCAQKEKR